MSDDAIECRIRSGITFAEAAMIQFDLYEFCDDEVPFTMVLKSRHRREAARRSYEQRMTREGTP